METATPLFVKITPEYLMIGNRSYPEGAVVQVEDDRQFKQLTEAGHAESHPGPAVDPSAPKRGRLPG